MTPEEQLALELRRELAARVNGWKGERAELLQAATRIAELDALIAYAEDPDRTSYRVAPRESPTREPVLDQRQ
jgi:hypothetical protein